MASSSTTRMSHHSASSRPPATAKPLTAAITGFDSCIRDGPIGPGPVRWTGFASGVPKALRSAPAQKVPLSPHSTATAAESSRSNSSNAAYSPAAAGPLTALRASGRFMITVVTGPLRSTRTPPSVLVPVMSPPSIRCPCVGRQFGGEVVIRPSQGRARPVVGQQFARAAPGRRAGGGPSPRRARTGRERRQRRDISSSRRCPVRAHSGRSHSVGDQTRPRRRRGPAAPGAGPQVVGQLRVEVRRAASRRPRAARRTACRATSFAARRGSGRRCRRW